MSQDFFDEEYEKKLEEKKKQEEQKKIDDSERRRREFDEWYHYTADNGGNNSDGGNGGGAMPRKRTKPVYIVLLCVALILAMVLGWFLCAIFGNVGSSATTGKDDDYLSLLAKVFDYLNNSYLNGEDISEEEWQDAVEAAGTALLQAAGDQYCRLMSPQSYYDFYLSMSGTSSTLNSSEGYFGIRYSFSSYGLVVSDIIADSSCYGLIETGDIVLKLSDVSYDDEIYAQNNSTFEKTSEIVFSDSIFSGDDASELVQEIMASVTSAKFHVLRDGEVKVLPEENGDSVISKGKYGLENDIYNFSSVEFYFGDGYTNISTTPQNNAMYSTKELRSLDQLSSDTGYIHLTEFTSNAADEFETAMELFAESGCKRLVLDLKGNGGGLVDTAVTIAGMLVTDANLTSQQKQTVARNNKLLIVTLTNKESKSTEEFAESSYFNYFSAPSGDKCDIVIWTDGDSASASELLTGALLDYGTGFQIGATTYGKGIAQTISQLPYTGTVTTSNGQKKTEYWYIYYTYANYYSPLGTNIHGKGYTPSDGYNNILDYADLVSATKTYWGN